MISAVVLIGLLILALAGSAPRSSGFSGGFHTSGGLHDGGGHGGRR